MNVTKLATSQSQASSAYFQMHVWHLSLLTVVVAIAITNIQDQRRSEPALIASAVAGFAFYTFLGWAIWKVLLRFRSRIGTIPFVGIYSVTMSILFLIATIAYLVIEHAYLVGF
jgi:xanthine/uracil permease